MENNFISIIGYNIWCSLTYEEQLSLMIDYVDNLNGYEVTFSD